MKTRICVPIVERTLDAFREAIVKVPGAADAIELRLDYLDDLNLENAADQVGRLLKTRNAFFVLTYRPREQGGARQLTRDERLDFWDKIRPAVIKHSKMLCDIEWDIADDPRLNWLKSERRIVSYHNFSDTLDKEAEIFNLLLDRPARVIKLAVSGKSITDCVRIKEYLAIAQSKGRVMIGITMDEPGLISRLIGPSCGSYFTFASTDRGKNSAPGQITIDEMIRVYRVRNITYDNLFTGLIGNPVSHSVSPAMHNAAFAAIRWNAVYVPMLVDDLPEFIKRIVRPTTQELDWNMRGFSVTIPHKVAIMPLLNNLSDTARAVGAVNTVVVEQDDLIGHNTDVEGAISPLERITSLKSARVAVIGTGGAARAVIYGLKQTGSEVTIFGRRTEVAAKLAEEFKTDSADWNSLGKEDFEIVINTTPIGMAGHKTENTIPDAAVTKCKIFYDLVYNPLETELMKIASAAGVQVLGGLEMLVAQGAEQFEIWTLQDAPIDIMREAALKRLTSLNQDSTGAA